MFIGFVIWSIVAMVFVGIGCSCRKSDKAVGFFTFSEPPIVEDVKAYNNAVAVLWIVAAVVFEMLGIPLLLLEQNSLLFVPVIFAVMIWVIGLVIVYLKIEARYKKTN